MVTWTLGPVLLGSLDLTRIGKGHPFVAALKIVCGLLAGRRLRDQVRRHLAVTGILPILVMPFEEYHSIDSERLQTCKAGFAFEDPASGRIRVVPVCAYALIRDNVERRIMAKYGAVGASDSALAQRPAA